MSQHLLRLIQQISSNAQAASKPTDIVFGTVKTVSPLSVETDQKVILPEAFLELSRNVTDFDVDMTVNHVVEKSAGGSHDPAFQAHDHMYKGRWTFRVHNGLQVGEKVIMIARAGGQSFVIIDRVG